MRVAALYDIHANLPALEAVLEDVRQADADQVVVGGDILPGPMPRETIKCLLDLDLPVKFIQGNGELAVLAQIQSTRTGVVTYWGTTSGEPLPEPYLGNYRWTAGQLRPEDESLLASWPNTLQLEIDGLGGVLFCHGTPRSETEIFTRLTSEALLLPLFEGLGVSVVVCGHTHMQFDRRIGKTRAVNAGSVGESYGTPGACWLLLGPDVQFQHTPYDLLKAAEQIRQTSYPQAEAFAHNVLNPPSEEEMLELFTPWELR
jgi:predicted phosphodiesterase